LYRQSKEDLKSVPKVARGKGGKFPLLRYGGVRQKGKGRGEKAFKKKTLLQAKAKKTKSGQIGVNEDPDEESK